MRKTLFTLFIVFLSFGFLSARAKADKKLFKGGYIKSTMKNAADWQLKNPKHNLYDWTNGAFYAGMFAAYETTQSKTILKAIMDMGEATAWKPGPRLHHADDIAICQTYIDMYRLKKDEKMIAPFIERVEKFRATPFETKEIQKCTWWWCDALFMGPTAYIKLANTIHDPSLLEMTDKLFKECYDLLYDKEEKLYARDIRYKWNEPDIKVLTESNGKKVFWSRGNGWVLGGLARMLDELPSDYPQREFYIRNFREMAEKLASLQQSDGLWRASLLDPAAYPGGEASGSGFNCYAMAWGINHGILDKATYLPVVRKAWIGLNSLIQPDGRVGWVQPIGADPRKNFSAESWEVYGTGAFLLAGSEIIKLF